MRVLKLDPTTRVPMFSQIVNQVIAQVDSGDLRLGDRLPASRRLAEDLGINRSTVVRAYQELWSLGYIETRPGGYSTVRARLQMAELPGSDRKGIIDWRQFAENAQVPVTDPHPVSDSGLIDFSRLVPDERLYPTEPFRLSLNRVMRREGKRLLGYGDPLGYPGLRRYIAKRMRLHGVSVAPEQVMLTTGSQNAIELILKLMTRRGSAIAVESPTYSAVLPLLRYHGLSVLGTPMKEDGPDLDVLEQIFRKASPALFYTIPNFHNPTGITTGQTHRERLLELARKHRIPLLEDGFEEEMKYFGRGVLPIKSMDRDGLVIYVGSFSKVLFPGIRVGWVAADHACITQLADLRRATQLTGSPLIQAGLAEFCESGEYDRHIGRIHRDFRKRMQTALRSLRQLPETADRLTWTQPSGGYTLWLKVHDRKRSEQEWISCFTRAGVKLAPGSGHFNGEPDGVYFRLSIAERNEVEIREGLRRMGIALQEATDMQQNGSHVTR